MTVFRDLLRKKAHGIIKSIDEMPTDQKTMLPSELFGRDYNTLRDMVLEAGPELTDVLPPSVEFDQFGAGDRTMTVQRYAEIRCFCQQLFEYLAPSAPGK